MQNRMLEILDTFCNWEKVFYFKIKKNKCLQYFGISKCYMVILHYFNENLLLNFNCKANKVTEML